MFKKVLVKHISIEDCIGLSTEPAIDPTQNWYHALSTSTIESAYEGEQQFIVNKLLNGYSFYEISKQFKIPSNRVYAFRKQMQQDFAHLKKEVDKDWIRANNSDDLKQFLQITSQQVSKLSLSNFVELMISDYDQEARIKKWKRVPLQDIYEDIWNTHNKSCILAPREHLKTTSALQYLLKLIYTRKYPLEIDYFHLNAGIANEKIQKLQRFVELNPILSYNFQMEEARSWYQGGMKLKDGTVIKASGYREGVVGKHPHIILLDDVIDRTVIYSDTLNQKAIDKFYSDIYPMISKDEPDKKIIIIGTAQREDDLYSKLPADFHKQIFQAIVSEEKQQVLEPALFTWKGLQKVKADISKIHGEKYWLKEYMNVPFSAMGMVIKPEWIRTYATSPERKEMKIYQGWDLSVGKDIEKGDWTCGATIGILEMKEKTMIYLLDMYRARIDFAKRLKIIVEKANEWKPLKIAVEENVFQYDMVQLLKKQTNLPIEGVKNIKSKVERFQTDLAPHFENGKVYLHETMKDVVNELLSLPVGEFDDMSDAFCNAIKISSRKSKTPNIRLL